MTLLVRTCRFAKALFSGFRPGAFHTRLLVVALLLSFGHSQQAQAITYVSARAGNWSDATIWVGGVASGSTVTAADRVEVRHNLVYNLGADLVNEGILAVLGGEFRTPPAGGRSVFNRGASAQLIVRSGSFVLPLYQGTSALAGNLNNEGGRIYLDGSTVDIAQNWESIVFNGVVPRRVVLNTCLRVGENFTLKNGTDYYENTRVEIGLHGSGNYFFEGSAAALATATFKGTGLYHGGTSGNFDNKLFSTVAGGTGAITALEVPSVLKNEGTWMAQVASLCITSGNAPVGVFVPALPASACPIPGNATACVAAATPNADGTGPANNTDIDDDNDGLPDALELGLADALLDYPFFDKDYDGIPNFRDADTAGYIAPAGLDSDNDGLDNAYDNNDAAFAGAANNGIAPVNTDALFVGTDTVPDYLDLNSDGDSAPDWAEAFNDDLSPDQNVLNDLKLRATNFNTAFGAVRYDNAVDANANGYADPLDGHSPDARLAWFTDEAPARAWLVRQDSDRASARTVSRRAADRT